MHALFVTADLGGNVPPTLAVARALAGHGAEVAIAGLDPGRSELPQLPLAAASAINPAAGKRGFAKSGGLLRFVTGRAVSASVAALVRGRDPDVVVVDCMALGALRGALSTGVPTVVLFHSFGGYWEQSFLRGPAASALALLGVAPARLWGGATARIILSDPALDPSSAAPALRSFLWAGSTEQGAPPEPGEERPLVLVSLSATDWPGMLPVYRRIVAALTTLPVEAVVTTGDVDLGGELRGSPNVTVTGWLDHTRVLPRASLLVGHGGHSTTLKALAHGVPVLTLPINPISDQRLIGTVIERHGLGATLPKRASTARLRSTISALLADPDSRERAARAGERLRGSARGAERAAAWVAALARRA